MERTGLEPAGNRLLPEHWRAPAVRVGALSPGWRSAAEICRVNGARYAEIPAVRDLCYNSINFINILLNTMSTAPFIRPQLTLPNGADKLLLHSCCAPCSGEVMEAIQASGIDYTIFFYNPNIHPQKEYLIRKEENIRFAEKHGVPFVDADYDTDNWFERAKGMEWEPERGIRCTMCFDMRFERTALYAAENGFRVISSSLGISRWK